MSDTTLIPPEGDKAPGSYGTTPALYVKYVDLPPGILLRPEGIAFKHPIFAVSVAVMVVTSLLTFWMPGMNGLLGGSLGGYHSGHMKRALGAAVVNAVAVPAMLLFLNYISEQPALLFLMGLSFKEWVAAHIIGTFLGAIGGAFSRPRITERDLYAGAH